jgi:hypothetical protein
MGSALKRAIRNKTVGMATLPLSPLLYRRALFPASVAARRETAGLILDSGFVRISSVPPESPWLAVS